MALGLAIAGLLGSALLGTVGGIVSAKSQREANQANIDEAQKNRDWQEYMSNTAHQREVTDLKAAGLNPWLSVSGSGAPVTSGSTATSYPVGDYGLSNVSSALQSLAFMEALGHRGSTASQRQVYNVLKVFR